MAWLVCRKGRRRQDLTVTVNALLEQYGDRVLPIERAEAEAAATLRASCAANGHTLHLADALIAGTAAAHQLQIATRNTRDFESTGVVLINPWEPER